MWLLVTFASGCFFATAAFVSADHASRARSLLGIGILVRLGSALASGDLFITGTGALMSAFLPAALALAAGREEATPQAAYATPRGFARS